MSLFRFNDIQKEQQTERQTASYIPAPADKPATISGSATEVLKNITYVASEAGSLHFVTNGVFSMHEALRSFLLLAGPSKVYISTWAMSENPARAIKCMIDDGLILELNFLFDFKTKKNSPKAMQLAEGISNKIHFSHCHAKATVIINDTNGIVIIGSPNYTRNPRIEVGSVSMDKRIAEFHRDWIMKEISNESVFNNQSDESQ